jgi:hypothetical protein
VVDHDDEPHDEEEDDRLSDVSDVSGLSGAEWKPAGGRNTANILVTPNHY